jgi:hypothetical protein
MGKKIVTIAELTVTIPTKTHCLTAAMGTAVGVKTGVIV